MKVVKKDNSNERRVLIAMIVDKAALAAIVAQWPQQKGLFSSRSSNLIAGWCITYFTKYQKAPGKEIEVLFDKWAERNHDKELVKVIEKFLGGLSDQYATLKKQANTDHTLDIASQYFRLCRLEELKAGMEAALELKDVDKAEKAMAAYQPIAIGETAGIDVLNDRAAFDKVFEEGNEVLIKHKGPLGAFYDSTFERDGLVAFLAPEKRGKSFMLIDVAWRAMEQGRRVAFFSAGDMSQNQLQRRLLARAAKRPWKPQTIKLPVGIEPGDEVLTTMEEKVYTDFMPTDQAWKAFQKKAAKLGPQPLRMACYPNDTATVGMISGVLDEWERQGWEADIVVIDYADILAPPHGFKESRDQINATWKHLRRLSQQRHICVVTATQSDAASYDTDLLSRKNFSEDKRKYAHVTAMIGINQKEKEKERQLFRLNYLVLRESEFFESRCVYVAGCLGVVNPCMLSCFAYGDANPETFKPERKPMRKRP